jgi:hypothetical protein
MPKARVHLLLSASAVAIAVAAIGVQAQSTLPLVQQSNLVYEGAFRVPEGRIGGSTFAYGGYALAYNAEHNSLFMVGHAQEQQVAEISIPDIRTGSGLSELATATVLQPFADVLENRMDVVNPNDGNAKMIGGMLPYQGKLFISVYASYDAALTQVLSHFISGTTLGTTGDLRGPFRVGTVGAHFIDGYFGEVPATLQAMLGGPVVNGHCCISIVSGTSYGPALFAINPSDIGAKTPAPATALVYYPNDHFVNDWNVKSTFFNGSTSVRGVVIPAGTRSVLFFGTQGLGPFCYGGGDACKDPANPYQGAHAYPYVSYVWAYDANDLAAVKSGKKKPWDVRPYGTWQLSLPFANDEIPAINGATFDPHTGRLFITRHKGDGERPLVHVFTISNATPPPTPPKNVRAR